ncbi:MAG TPA: Mn transporter [Elusimicrobia bacterium]|nr:MAG: Mn transporter [Elusimicrobia bacterium RIFOXYA12_FULL_49_49]OGS08635.1 MAG: Mn transporter [Elusimicrobia bacterium RIFOXYA1_FULL_47_7]OGS10731.1 MAG: Mn transporter [Elusimicrobia bacterium RIFOXYB1_FULL_48_9]OGS14759.1 MAG: Mn transporter [Elusimicrobia bacterium RIFOXYA2_FULL_47_53]OGS25590.1 MAG: Mn transporter [Elusimicrobia bacterium RIFOXYB12_FULL_50_12]OGS28957.1 MAG: Mn transporter [Elusimicrobia bacterium RIFOXYB2_FULL_46_23]HBU69600.1 Mn transporter [Elusimicrobiota bacter
MNIIKKIKENSFVRNIIIFLSVMGPGVITANVDNDAGGITTYSLAGANYGYTLLWSLVPITFALIIIQEMCNRMGVVTGKGLSDLIREKFGVKMTFYIMLLILVTNFGNIMSEFAGVAASAELFGISKFIAIPMSAFIVWYMVVKGTYRSVEKIFLVACVFYVSYLITGFLVNPPWHQIYREFVRPSISFETGYLMMLVAVIGTTIAPWMQFYQQSSVAEKGIKIEDYKYSRMDVIVGSIGVNVVAFFIIVVCGTVLFQGSGFTPIQTAGDAARVLKPLAGDYSSYLFAFGLLNASLFAASILPLSTAYSVSESFGWETGVNKNFAEAPQFYILYSLLIVLGASVVLFPIPLIKIMWLTQFINGLVLPFVLAAMLIIINDKKIMGEYSNTRLFNYLTIACIGGISLLSFLLVIGSI